MNTIQLKRGTYNRWISTATVLGSGELGLDTTNNIIKVGNGSGTWGNLPIFNTNISGVFSATTGIFQDIVANGSGDIILSANNDLGFPILSVSRTGVVNVNGVSNFNSVPLVSGVPVSLSGHSHASSDITNFNASVSGLVSGIYAPLSGKLNQFASTSSAELFSIISDDTGSGLLVFNTSPSFSGVPTVPTASSGTNTNQIASTSFVRTEISNLLASAPSTLDTLNELATALGNDANFSTTITNSLAGKANLSGATFTGRVSAPTGNFTILQQNGTAVSVSGHAHTAVEITYDPLGVATSATNVQMALEDIENALENRIGITQYASASDVGVVKIGSGITIGNSGLISVSTNYAAPTHNHTSSQITNFNTSVSGLVSGIYYLNSNPSGYTNNVGTVTSVSALILGTTGTDVSSSVSNSSTSPVITLNLPSASSSNRGLLTSSDWSTFNNKQPSGNYSIVGHTHTSSNITDFNTAVASASPEEIVEYLATTNFPAVGNSTLLYIATDASRAYRWTGSEYIEVGSSASYVANHSHSANDITNFNSSVSGLLPITSILAGNNVSVAASGTSYIISSSGTGGGSSIKLGTIMALS